MAYITIDSINVKTPSSMSVTLQDVDNETYRNAKGELIRDRVCGGDNAKRKISLTWNWLTETEIKTLLNAVKKTFFSVKYYDPYVCGTTTKTMYVGDRTAQCYTTRTKQKGYRNVSFNLIER